MANESAVWDEGNLFAENSLTAKQFYFVELSAKNQVDVCDGATDLPLGILQNDPAAGQEARVRKLGKSQLVVDGTANGGIAVGSWIGTDNAGKGVKKSADHDIITAVANEAATTDGAIIEVFMITPFTLSA